MNIYKEQIDIIARGCKARGIPFTTNPIYEGWQIRFPWCEGDIACHDFTYGVRAGKVESYRFPWDEDSVSVLTPEEAIERITKYWAETLANFIVTYLNSITRED